MRKSILRFGALALMSLMSINSWAQLNVGDPFEDAKGNSYLVVTKFTPAQGQTAAVQGEAQLISLADASGNAVDLSKVTPKSGTVGTVSGESYKITEVGPSAAVRVTTNVVTVTIPNEKVTLNIAAFANQKVTVKLKDGKLHPDTEIRPNAFKNAKVTTTKDDNFLDFSNRELPANAFYDVNFETGTTIYMGNQELSEGVFGASSSKGDIQTVQFRLDSKITTVPAKAFMNRTGLKNFGYNDGSFLLPTYLYEIGDYAFAGTSLTQFKFSDRDEDSKIEEVGNYAFSGCTWMTNDVFKETCKPFAELQFDEGSFQGCGFTSVNLGNNARTISINTNFGTGKANYENLSGVPARAFENNSSLTSLTFGDATFEAIGAYAFAGTALAKVVLPEGIMYLDEGAFALVEAQNNSTHATNSPEIISLPTTLKGIREDALKNRYIEKIFVSPGFSYGTDFNVPTLENQSGLTVASMQLPTVKRNPTYGNNGQLTGYQTPKTVFDNAGWKSVSGNKTITLAYASEFSNAPVSDYYYYVIYDGVKYKIDQSSINVTGSENAKYGYFDATVVAFTENNATVHGMIQTAKVNYDAAKTGGGTEQKEATLKGGGYEYSNIVLNVKGFAVTEGQSPESAVSHKLDKDDKCSMTNVAFKMDAYPVTEQENSAAEDFVNIAGTKYTAIPAKMFSTGCTTLKDITLAEGITSVGASAFEGTSITSIDLPASLVAGTVTAGQTLIGSKAFNNGKITTVNIKSHPTGTIVGLPVDAFANGTKPKAGGGTEEDEDHFAAKLVVSGSKYNRSAYLAVTGWSKFFKLTNTFKEIKAATKTSDPDVVNTVCADENGVFVFDDDVKAVQITEKIGTEAVSGTSGTPEVKVSVKYNRTFGNTSWQAISLPFDVPVESITKAGLEVAELYNIRLNGETGALEAVVWVKLQKGVMNAFTPYVIKADKVDEKKTIELNAVIKANYNSSSKEYTTGTVDCSSTKELYTLTSNFGPTNMWDAKGYYLGGGEFNWTSETQQQILKPYRFYMTRIQRPIEDEEHPTYLYGSFSKPDSYDTTPTQSVKVVVLDDEEEAATYINSLSVRDAENLSAPMYDITGRQIVSPVKGQVYIQNGVKKLAK